MRTATFISAVSALMVAGTSAQNLTTGVLGDAIPVLNNPVGPVYTATLPPVQFFNPADPRGNIKGSVSATAAPGGKGVQFTINFSNLPTSGGPFPYHIHVAPVNSTGSCASTLAHLDPFIRGETPVCDPSKPATCQSGDLSGKYGKITSDPFTASYVDLYASLVPGLGSFFGNRSITVHFSNATRITCASFALVSGTGTTSPNSTTTTKPTPSTYTGAAGTVGASLISVLAAAAIAMVL